MPANEVLAEMNEWTNNNLEVLKLPKCSISESFRRYVETVYVYSKIVLKFRSISFFDACLV